jgi:hypothetical protein
MFNLVHSILQKLVKERRVYYRGEGRDEVEGVGKGVYCLEAREEIREGELCLESREEISEREEERSV